MNGKLVLVHFEGSMAPGILEDLICSCSSRIAAQSIVHALRTVCIAQSCAYVIAIQIQHSIGDHDFYLIMMVMTMTTTTTVKD